MSFQHTRQGSGRSGLLAVSATAALADKVVVSNWDGYMPKDMAEKFKAATGHRPRSGRPCHQ